jgi:type I restriction enzyme M protein
MLSQKTLNIASFLHSISDILRGDYKRSDFGKVILPFTLLRRVECLLDELPNDTLVSNKANLRLKDCLINSQVNLFAYIQGFSSDIIDIFKHFEFDRQIEKLAHVNVLSLIIAKFVQVDLHPSVVSNADMGLIFEELIRQFAEDSNETSGEHYTPREVIKLLVDLLFFDDCSNSDIRTIYDPTAGTGGMLSVAEDYLKTKNANIKLVVHSQELNGESYAVCKSDMLLRGHDIGLIKFGNTLSNDQHANAKFDYSISNPPFGVEWKKVEKEIRLEHEKLGFDGRFGAGLPRVSDGSLLFLQHLISKMKAPQDGGGRIAIVLNGSPLFTGGAGSGESDIRKYIMENDLLETIIGLPTDIFYNTGIATYIWLLSNRKAPERRGRVQLINAINMYRRMRKSLGSKRNELSQEHINEIVRLYAEYKENNTSKIFKNEDFGYYTITVERPLKDIDGNDILLTKGKQKGQIQPDPNLRDTENIPINDDIHDYFKREVLPHVPDAWIDHEKTKIGYEFSFNKQFYEHTPLRDLRDIEKEIRQLNKEIIALMDDIFDDDEFY